MDWHVRQIETLKKEIVEAEQDGEAELAVALLRERLQVLMGTVAQLGTPETVQPTDDNLLE